MGKVTAAGQKVVGGLATDPVEDARPYTRAALTMQVLEGAAARRTINALTIRDTQVKISRVLLMGSGRNLDQIVAQT